MSGELSSSLEDVKAVPESSRWIRGSKGRAKAPSECITGMMAEYAVMRNG